MKYYIVKFVDGRIDNGTVLGAYSNLKQAQKVLARIGNRESEGRPVMINDWTRTYSDAVTVGITKSYL